MLQTIGELKGFIGTGLVGNSEKSPPAQSGVLWPGDGPSWVQLGAVQLIMEM